MIHVQMYEFLFDLNQHYQQMIDTLQQLASFYPALRQDDFKPYELRLKELKSCANVRFLESLLVAEVSDCDRYRKEIQDLGGQVLPEQDKVLSERRDEPPKDDC